MMEGVILEACVESLEQAIVAEKKGASRVELCANLAVDGLTPSREFMQQAVAQLSIPVRIMIRPRAGEFVYSEEELEEMKSSIQFAKEIGAEGVVFGILTETKEVDIPKVEELARLSSPLGVTIHKAIDDADDPLLALKKLEKIEGIDTVLTSGKSATAKDGTSQLKKMCTEAEKIQIMPCGKITSENFSELHTQIGATAYHGKLIVGVLS